LNIANAIDVTAGSGSHDITIGTGNGDITLAGSLKAPATIFLLAAGGISTITAGLTLDSSSSSGSAGSIYIEAGGGASGETSIS